jgi:hypothetical protein
MDDKGERKIAALLDVNPEKSFEGGCDFLLNWYNEIIGDRNET